MDNKVFFVPHTNWVSQGSGTNLKTKEIPCLTGKGKPTAETAGAVGCWYMDTDSGTVYKCTAAADGVYTWIDLVNSDELRCIVEAYLQENPPEDGADGGHYTPVITQPTADTMKVEFLPSRAGMAAVEPVEIKLPVGSGNDSGQNVELDSSLTQGGKAADAKATGDEIKRVEGLIPIIEGLAKTEDIPKVPNWAMQTSKPGYTASEVGADPKGAAASAVNAHNANTDAHTDLRLEIRAIREQLTAFLDVDEETLNELSELIARIVANQTSIAQLTTGKVNVTDIIDNLTTNVANKPLSAAQGVAIKALIDGLSTGKLDASKLQEAINTALAQAKASGAFDGAKGDPGRGIKSIARTSGNGAAGTTDTYTVTYTDNTTSTFTVRNGSNGAPGQAATLEITSVTALAPGAAPTITEASDSTAQARRYALAIPQGAPGYTPVKFVDYWTDEDQETIVQQVIAALGTPVFGRVDADNNIILTGELADGEYTVKYEDAEGNLTEIGTYTAGGTIDVPITPVWNKGYKLDSNTGKASGDSGNMYAYSDGIPFIDGTEIHISCSSNRAFHAHWYYYDANDNFVGKTDWVVGAYDDTATSTPDTVIPQMQGAAVVKLRCNVAADGQWQRLDYLTIYRRYLRGDV